ncbi:MAG TPA: GAF domain-containing sensor histidine kinase [Caldisericia bacterium]|nr:GAF domain-containing sensor histidine kinase [Caldisericia bacterium]HRV74912.1 GAF domain-containing sensor histidine kinase [Caldisericia bacterium]
METVHGNEIKHKANHLLNDESLNFLIVIRWFASLGLFITSITFYINPGTYNAFYLAIITFVLVASNYFHQLCLKRKLIKLETMLYIQVLFDWILLFFVAFCTGGITSPAAFIFVIYGSVIGFLLQIRMAYTLNIVCFLMIAGLLVESLLNKPLTQSGIIETIGISILYSVVLMIITYVSNWISRRIREQLETSTVLSERLDIENIRLSKFYELSLEMNSDLSLENTLRAITKIISQMPGIAACVVRLLSEDGKMIKIMDTYGVSQEHASRESISIEKCKIDKEAIENKKPVYVADVLKHPNYLYKYDAKAEKLVSMVSIPLISRNIAHGVIRCYTDKKHIFSENELKFLVTVASGASLSIANAYQYKKVDSLNKSRSAFLRLATHELRSPMAAVQSILTLVLDGFTGPINKKQKELFERANHRIDRLLMLVKELLEIEGMSAKPLEFTNVNLRDLLSTVVADIAPKSDAKGIKMRVHIPRGDITLGCDREAMYRVFENLIDNGVKYSKDNGVFMIIVEETENNIQIEFIDNGIGIPQDSIDKLFGEFYRAANAKKIETHGTGLGLAITKKIIESHSGSISVSSKLNEGTRFVVVLPKNQVNQN